MRVSKLLHTRYRLNDLERSVKFYQEVLGLEEVRRHKSPRGSELVFLKAPESEETVELCHFPNSGPVEVQPVRFPFPAAGARHGRGERDAGFLLRRRPACQPPIAGRPQERMRRPSSRKMPLNIISRACGLLALASASFSVMRRSFTRL